MTANEPLCARCARCQSTCCQETEIFVTLGDIERIAQHTGERDFHEFRPVRNSVYLEQQDDPLWERVVLRPDGTRRVVKWQENRDCRFLGPVGCRLPLDVRPLICRLYPFDYNEQGIKPQLATGCPTFLLKPEESLIQVLDMSPVRGAEWHRQLYEEIRIEDRANVNAASPLADVEASADEGRSHLRPAC